MVLSLEVEAPGARAMIVVLKMSTASLLLLLVSSFAVVNSVIMNPEIVLKPTDTNAPRSHVLPLSCAATSDGGDPVVIRWRRQFNSVFTSISATPVTQSYRSDSGRDYTVSTIFLCDLDFNDVGTYVCDVLGSNEQQMVQVIVHTPSSANFQLRLSGVGNCGGWVSTNTPTKLQSIIGHLESNVLNTFCTDGNQCSFNITNYLFNCVGDQSSNSVTFQATIEHRLQVEAVGQDASEMVTAIGVWKDTEPSLVVSSQSLAVLSSCDVDSFTVCGTPSDGGGGGGGGTSIGPIVGGILGAIVCVCVIVVIIVVALVIMKRYGKDSSTIPPADKDYTHTDFNMSYGVASETLTYKGKDAKNDYSPHYIPNPAYGTSVTKDPRRPSGGRRNMPLPPDRVEKVEYYASFNKDAKMYEDIVVHQVNPRDYETPVERSHVDNDEEVYDYIDDRVARM